MHKFTQGFSVIFYAFCWFACEPSSQLQKQTHSLIHPPEITIEAEEMNLDGYVVESKWYSDEYIATYNRGSAWAAFDGPSGVYELKLFILEEDDGRPKLNLFVAGNHIGYVKYKLGSCQRDPRTIVFAEVYLDHADEIRLHGIMNEDAGARVDKLVLEAVSGGQASIEAEHMKLSNYQIESSDGYAGSYIATYSTGSTRIRFPGRDDFYNISLTVVCENDGQPELDLFVGTDHIRTVTYPLCQSPREPATIDLSLWWVGRGDPIRLVGYRMDNGMARVDRLDFTIQ